MTFSSKLATQLSCYTEYDTLREVLVCPPEFMRIQEVINETQKAYSRTNINREIALAQHRAFTDSLREQGVNVHTLTPLEQLPEQVFTRDIGFVAEEQLLIGELATPVRQGEEQQLKKWAASQGISYTQLPPSQIEGGDVLVHRNRLFVGLSHRTSRNALKGLQRAFPDKVLIPLEFNPKYLHLDCVFNVLSEKEALVFPAAFTPESYERLSQVFDLIPVTAKEQFAMGTNVLSIGDKRVYSQPQNHQVNAELTRRGYTVLPIDFSEIIKSGGAFRCCTLPLIRG